MLAANPGAAGVNRALRPDEVAVRAQMAALLEASAPKPGNVGPQHDFRDAGYEHFLLSAAAIGPALHDVAGAGVGAVATQAPASG